MTVDMSAYEPKDAGSRKVLSLFDLLAEKAPAVAEDCPDYDNLDRTLNQLAAAAGNDISFEPSSAYVLLEPSSVYRKP